MRRDAPFTCPGLGDRIHSALLAWQWSKGEPVSVHITDDKWSIAGGVLSDKKKKSWAEIVKLFPGKVQIVPHHASFGVGCSEEDWLHFLEVKGIFAQTYYYEDSLYMHPCDYDIGIDASGLLFKLPELSISKPDNVQELSEGDHIAFNIDSTDQKRMINESFFNEIMKKETLGFELKTIKITSNMSLEEAGYIISKAKKYVGIDSGIFHLATLFKSWKDIHLLTRQDGFKSHHFNRAVRNGSQISEQF